MTCWKVKDVLRGALHFERNRTIGFVQVTPAAHPSQLPDRVHGNPCNRGVELWTFRVAGSVLRLLQDDTEYEQALREAATTQLDKQLREVLGDYPSPPLIHEPSRHMGEIQGPVDGRLQVRQPDGFPFTYAEPKFTRQIETERNRLPRIAYDHNVGEPHNFYEVT